MKTTREKKTNTIMRHRNVASPRTKISQTSAIGQRAEFSFDAQVSGSGDAI